MAPWPCSSFPVLSQRCHSAEVSSVITGSSGDNWQVSLPLPFWDSGSSGICIQRLGLYCSTPLSIRVFRKVFFHLILKDCLTMPNLTQATPPSPHHYSKNFLMSPPNSSPILLAPLSPMGSLLTCEFPASQADSSRVSAFMSCHTLTLGWAFVMQLLLSHPCSLSVLLVIIL